MPLTAKDLLQFLDIRDVTLANVQRELAMRLADMYECDVQVGLGCPITDSGTALTISLHTSQTDVAEVIKIKSLEDISNSPLFPFSRLIQIPDLAEDLGDVPITLVRFSKDIGAEDLLEMEIAVSEFFRAVIDSLSRTVRTSLIR